MPAKTPMEAAVTPGVPAAILICIEAPMASSEAVRPRLPIMRSGRLPMRSTGCELGW